MLLFWQVCGPFNQTLAEPASLSTDQSVLQVSLCRPGNSGAGPHGSDFRTLQR